MEKKHYMLPYVETVAVSGGYMMLGDASVPSDPFSAPGRHDPKGRDPELF